MKSYALCSLALTFLLIALARPATAGGCEKDSDCKGDRICQSAVCVAPATTATCGTDKDCSGDLVCDASVCAPPKPTAAPGASDVPMRLGDALPPKSALVEASFASAPGSALEISLDDPAGLKRCIAPCSLQVAPGEHVVLVRGARSFSAKVQIPIGGGAFDVTTASPPGNRPLKIVAVVGGLALMGVGVYGASHGSPALGVGGFVLGTSAATIGVLTLAIGTTGTDAVQLRGRTIAANVGFAF